MLDCLLLSLLAHPATLLSTKEFHSLLQELFSVDVLFPLLTVLFDVVNEVGTRILQVRSVEGRDPGELFKGFPLSLNNPRNNLLAAFVGLHVLQLLHMNFIISHFAS